MSKQAQQAAHFRALHQQGLILPNAWDAASARLFEQAGFAAIGTTSAGIAYARGQRDGQALTRTHMLHEVKNIVQAVQVPVTADIEAGYGSAPEDVAQTVRQFLDIGVVGVNLEDATHDPQQPLFAPSWQAKRLSAARQAMKTSGIDAYLNARTDTYLTGFGANETERLEETIVRARTYLDAGADSIFIPGVTELQTIRTLCQEIGGPIAIMALPDGPSPLALLAAGASRVSIGQLGMLGVMAFTQRLAADLRSGHLDALQGHCYGFAEAEALFINKTS